jgi:hypothetical protein
MGAGRFSLCLDSLNDPRRSYSGIRQALEHRRVDLNCSEL